MGWVLLAKRVIREASPMKELRRGVALSDPAISSIDQLPAAENTPTGQATTFHTIVHVPAFSGLPLRCMIGPMHELSPSWLRRAGPAAWAAALAFTAILLTLALAGVSDPRPPGPLRVDEGPAQIAAWAVWPPGADVELLPDGVHLAAEQPGTRVYLIAPHTFSAPLAVETAARWGVGPEENAYGLWWGLGPQGDHTVVTVSAAGYLAVYRIGADGTTPIREAARFPHVGRGDALNRLRIDLGADGAVTVRLNDELVMTFMGDPPGDLALGVLVETFNRGGGAAGFERLQVWGPVEPIPQP
ncbi:MAG: hypothetical protein Kow00124_16240 [Anaerolineae bacterium]